ncbi:hypothetical protein Tco_0299552 [Tanacetum coccineum]
MLAISHNMIEESVEVFMDDFSVFGNSFDNCLNNLDKMLQRCKDANLVLNWENVTLWLKKELCLDTKCPEQALKLTKLRLIWSSLRQKGTENVAVDHLSWIENDETSDDSEVDDNFPRETLMEITTIDIPKDGKTFIVNGHRLKLYHEEDDIITKGKKSLPSFPKTEPLEYEST